MNHKALLVSLMLGGNALSAANSLPESDPELIDIWGSVL